MRSTVFLLSSFQVTVTVLLAVVPFISATAHPQPTVVPGVPPDLSWEVGGCYSDSKNARALSVQASVQGGPHNNTVENCINACSESYLAAGVENGYECWCGNSLENGSTEINMRNCFLACPGDKTENCGGPHAFLLYNYYGG